MRAITQSGRWPGNEAIGAHVIYSESEEAAASSASMLGTPMYNVGNIYFDLVPTQQLFQTIVPLAHAGPTMSCFHLGIIYYG